MWRCPWVPNRPSTDGHPESIMIGALTTLLLGLGVPGDPPSAWPEPLRSERPGGYEPAWWRIHLYEHYPRLLFALDLLTFHVYGEQVIEFLGKPDISYTSRTHGYLRYYRFGLEFVCGLDSGDDVERVVWARFIGHDKIPYRWLAADRDELRRLQGIWGVVAVDENGVRSEKFPGMVILIDGDVVVVVGGGIALGAPFRLVRMEGYSGLAISPEVRGGPFGPEGFAV